MGISASELYNKITTDLDEYNAGDYKNEKENPRQISIMGDAMKEYFEENIEVTYTWLAASPPPANTPDPVESFKSTVHFSNFDIADSNNLDTMAGFIRTAFDGTDIRHPAEFLVDSGSFLALNAPTFAMTTNADNAILNCICTPLCTWVLTLINPAPLKGKHGVYIGTTKGMVIA
jgi:hypothetical protein